jgi:hypothetical protein
MLFYDRPTLLLIDGGARRAGAACRSLAEPVRGDKRDKNNSEQRVRLRVAVGDGFGLGRV